MTAREPTASALDAARLSLDFSGTVCIVTGAGQGIGRSVARAFAAHGAAVALADVSGSRGEEAAAEIRRGGGRALAIRTDVADRGAMGTLFGRVSAELGPAGVVVHNAAFFPVTPFEEIAPEILDRTLAVNLKAAFWLAQEALPGFRILGRGRLLVTSSVTGPRVAYPGLAHYAASKAGLNGFIRAAALELAPWGVTVNGVEPGMIDTPAQANLGEAEHTARIVRGIPAGRLGRPDEIAHAMLFLASAGASYITGQTLVVDGGALLPENGARILPPA